MLVCLAVAPVWFLLILFCFEFLVCILLLLYPWDMNMFGEYIDFVSSSVHSSVA